MRNKARSSLLSSFLASFQDEGGDQLDQLVDRGVEAMFSHRARSRMRNLADDALQATLYDALGSIDDPSERHRIYRESLSKLRPIVRDAVNAMYNEDAKNALKQHTSAAIPSLLQGEFETAISKLTDAMSDVTDYAEESLSANSQDLLHVFQEVSTKLLEESVEDLADSDINPEQIQGQIHDRVEEARAKLTDTVSNLQQGVEGAQSELRKRTGGGSGRTRKGPPRGLPPHGFPSSGQPPSGKPPSGLPPSGFPPFGRPPSGQPPILAHRRHPEGSRVARRR